jgi:hypothetical protein
MEHEKEEARLNLATTTAGRPSARSDGYLADMAVLLFGGFAFLVTVILWFDNAQGGQTGNGVFKSIELRDWVVDPARAPLYPANYFYYPVYGLGCRLLDLIGVFAGDPRRQMTILNAAGASICLTIVYLLARRITGDRVIALATALFHIACSDVLVLAVINEDIMTSYTVMFAAMALAGAWFARPTAWRVVAVSVLFTIGWLFEWRLMFPTLPAMAVALWLCEGRAARRVAWILLFLATMVAVAAITAWLTRHHVGAADTWGLIWTGKAVDSAWAGFTWMKGYYLADGVSAYLFGTRIAEMPGIPGWDLWRFTSIGCELALAASALTLLWRARDDRMSWSLFAVFGGTLVAGQVFNLYSQPHDPQMQINVMAWMTVGWALVLVAARRRWGARGLAAMVGLSAALLAHNVWCLAPLRGEDGKWQAAIARLARNADPAHTVFLMHDFDWASTYAAASWGSSEPVIDTLKPSPQAVPKFKRIGFAGGILLHHARGEAEQTAALHEQIDHAMDLGYDVVAVRLWDIDLSFLDRLTGSIAAPSVVNAMIDMLHRDYIASEIMDDPLLGKVYRLRRSAAR